MPGCAFSSADVRAGRRVALLQVDSRWESVE